MPLIALPPERCSTPSRLVLGNTCLIWHTWSEMKPLFFVGPTRADLRAFPDEVKDAVGFALHLAQMGDTHVHAKPLKGFAGAGVLEVVENHDGDTYRAVYTVRLAGAVYVLHVFQKKWKRGIATPRKEIGLIRSRLRRAEMDHANRFVEEDS